MRFSDVANPTVRFGACLKKRTCYGGGWCFHVSDGAVRCDFQIYSKYYGAVRCCDKSYGAVHAVPRLTDFAMVRGQSL